jgi:two-component system chemotaxis response regulator CheB
MFRSAALAYDGRVIGVLLSGELDDGTAGLWEIARRGGTTVVQNPEEAAFPSMPLSALREVEVNQTVAAADLGGLLNGLVGETKQDRQIRAEMRKDMWASEEELTDLTCPECRGAIWEVRRGKNKDYRCRVGHTFSAKSMLAGHFAAQEKALYAAMVALEEGASLANRLADQFEAEYGEPLRAEARERASQAGVIRQVLQDRLSFEI